MNEYLMHRIDEMTESEFEELEIYILQQRARQLTNEQTNFSNKADGSIEKSKNQIIALLRQSQILAEDLGVNVWVDSTLDDDGVHYDSWVQAGMYELRHFYDRDPSWHYRSPDGKEQINNLDPDRIISFSMPPIEKSPTTDQSKQGLTQLSL